MRKILIFAGTYEGRKLCEFCSEHKINADVSVATEYGKELVNRLVGIKVYTQRLNEIEMADLIEDRGYNLVVDATHPFAVEVTSNIKKACANTGCDYIRLLRDEENTQHENIIYVENIESAVKVLNEDDGKIMLTTGSKELQKYMGIKNLSERLIARVLPCNEALDECKKVGILLKNIICMQGPFSRELNIAMIKQYGCKYVVSKQSGDVGGFEDKIRASIETGTKLIVIKRPIEENGIRLEEMFKRLEGM